MKALVAVILVLVVLFLGYILFNESSTENTNPDQNQNSPTETPSENDETNVSDSPFTLEAIAKHDSKDDCWTVIEGKVYDLTPYIASNDHPGGASIELGCGIDSTNIFNAKPGDGEPHSEEANLELVKYYIGDLEE